MKEKIFKKYVRYDLGLDRNFLVICYVSLSLFSTFLFISFFDKKIDGAINFMGYLTAGLTGTFSIVLLICLILSWFNRDVYYKEVKQKNERN